MAFSEYQETNCPSNAPFPHNASKPCRLAAKLKLLPQNILPSSSRPPQLAGGFTHDGYTPKATPAHHRHHAPCKVKHHRNPLSIGRYFNQAPGPQDLLSPPFPTHLYHLSPMVHSTPLCHTFTSHLRPHPAPPISFSEALPVNAGPKKGQAGGSHLYMIRFPLRTL